MMRAEERRRTNPPSSIVFSPDGRLVGAGLNDETREGGIRIWRIEYGCLTPLGRTFVP